MEEPFHEKKNRYFQKIKINLLKKKGCWYKKCNQDNNLIIPAGWVLYVGIDLATEKESYLLQIEDHQDIMCAIHKQTVFILDVVLKSFCK